MNLIFSIIKKKIKKFLPRSLKIFFKIVITTRNWPIVFIKVFLERRETQAVFINGLRLRVSRKNWPEFMNYVNFFNHFPKGEINGSEVRINYKKNSLIFDVGRLGPSVLTEVFGWEAYKPFLSGVDFKNKTVIDIGASLGDTAVYFALLGAKKVYAFEPLSEFYKLALKNIETNGFKKVCEVFNVAVGGKKEKKCSKNINSKYIFDIDADNQTAGEVDFFSLDYIVRRFGIKNAFLKIDCEGCEYEIILKAPAEVLKCFDYILMEYHYGFENLKFKLEKTGFIVKQTTPIMAVRPERGDSHKKMAVGYLMAVRH